MSRWSPSACFPSATHLSMTLGKAMKLLFIDDSGNRKSLKQDRYFCLGGFCIDATDVHKLGPALNSVKARWGLAPCPDDEVKFSHIGRDRHSRSKPNPLYRDGHDFGSRIRFGFAVLASLLGIPSVRCVAVGIEKKNVYGRRTPVEHAVELVAERFQMELQDSGCHGMMICDEEQRHHEQFRQCILGGSWYMDMTRITETVMFVPSDYSAGVQYADMVIGAAARWWNHRDDKYVQELIPHFRWYRGDWKGAGMKSFPGHDYPAVEKKETGGLSATGH